MTKEEKKEYMKAYNAAHREEMKEYWKAWYAKNKEERLEKQKEYREAHKKERKEYKKAWYAEHREEQKAYNKAYNSSLQGRANMLLGGYRKQDRENNLGETTITADWIVQNIFTSTCTYCGETDWHKLGTDRIDNTKPHTPDNCICACGKCNNERSERYSVEEFSILKRETLL